jgi:5-methylcytosine-specific restriction endonuclease McrBC regulatory subunit McrC
MLSGQKRKASDNNKQEKRQKISHNENGVSIRTPFSRIKHDYAKALPTQLQDNTFEAKTRYGKGGDNYGIHSNEKLKIVDGKDFRKAKTKMKKKNFHGAGNRLTYTCNSIKL